MGRENGKTLLGTNKDDILRQEYTCEGSRKKIFSPVALNFKRFNEQTASVLGIQLNEQGLLWGFMSVHRGTEQNRLKDEPELCSANTGEAAAGLL